MAVKVAINGFGRIGRNVLRAIVESGRTDIEVVAINDLGPVETNAHLLRFDSVHGRFPAEVTTTDSTIDVGRGPIDVTAFAILPNFLGMVWMWFWNAQAFSQIGTRPRSFGKRCPPCFGSAPSKGADNTIVYGVNHDTLTSEQIIVSIASCTTNCLSPVAKALNDAIGIKRGFMTTIHSYTGDQPTLDTMHKDLYRARAAAMSMIPTSTGAAKAVGLVLPELNGKLDGVAIRVPTPNVSCVDLTFEAARDTTIEEVNAAVKSAAEGAMKGVLGYTDDPLVSMDFNHDPHSSVFASEQTKVMDGNMVRILTWYDNEWGFSNRMADTAVAMGKLI